MTPSGKAPGGYEIVDRTVCHDGFFRVERHRLRFRLFAGGWSDVVEREVIERGHAAAVLLYDPDLDRVVLVEQFRAAATGAPGGPWLIETVAGIIETGETAEATIRRETVEEAGSTVGDSVRIGEVMVSPGSSTERLTLYCGRIDAAAAAGVHGNAWEGEDIRVVTPLSLSCRCGNTGTAAARYWNFPKRLRPGHFAPLSHPTPPGLPA